MTWHKVKIDAADKAFSLYIRSRDKKCVHPLCNRTEFLQCSHFWGRGKESTRFDPENCDTLCPAHHRDWENQKEIKIRDKVVMGEYALFKLEQLGQARYDALKLRAHTRVKKDRKLALIKANELLKSLNL